MRRYLIPLLAAVSLTGVTAAAFAFQGGRTDSVRATSEEKMVPPARSSSSSGPSRAEPQPMAASAHGPMAMQTGADRMLLTAQEANFAAISGVLPAGVRTLLNSNGNMAHGEYVWNEDGAPASGPVLIYVDLRRQMVSAFRDGHEIGSAVILYGAPDMDTPTGTFKIQSRVADYHSRKYDAPMPFAIFINNDGVALHGSEMSSRRATHGCVGLPIAFAERLFDAASSGSFVEIVRSHADAVSVLDTAPMVRTPDN